MKNMFRRMPLIVRVSVALIAAAVLPLGYAVWSLFDVNRAGMHEQVLRTHAVAASTAAERIAGAVEARRALALTVASQEALTADPRSDGARQFLQDLLAADASLQIVDVITPAGEVVIRAQRRGAAERVGPIPAAAPAVWRNFLLVTQSAGGGAAVVRVIGEERVIPDSLQPAEIGEHAEIILASSDGKRLAGLAPLASFPKAMIAAARTARVNGTGVYRDAHGDEILGAFAPVAGTSWFVLSRQPAAMAQAIAGRMRRRALVAVSVALAMALLLAVAAHRTIIRPIREVIRTQKSLAGNTPLPTGNEIDQLRAASRSIQRRIVDQEELGRIFLGRYQILGIIGQGGMGTVFRGWDPKLRRHVALKTVHIGAMAEDMDLIESLVAEAITVASVSHPNIVAVYDVEDSADSAFMAMELVEGVSLQSYLDQRGTLSPELTAMVGLAVARGLEAAHAHSILHYDIKPANVLLGFDGAIKVADFGLAAIINRMIDTRDSVYGTPGYMSPEVATGQKGDPRADLFALGVVLYHCIVGALPFERDSAREIILASIYDTPPVLETRMDGGPVLHALSDLITSLMQKSIEARPPSASHVVQRLETLVQQHGLRWTIDPLEGDTPLVTGRGSATLIPTIILEPPR
jgi:hypothetical protein